MRAVYRRDLMILAMVGLCAPALAQVTCPELTKLRAESEAALNKVAKLTGEDRCYAYVRYSVAWSDIKTYAFAHAELCGLSTTSLSDLAAQHRKAIEAREEACGGHRSVSEPPKNDRKTFPPDIRMRNTR